MWSPDTGHMGLPPNPSLDVPIYKVGHNSICFKGFSCCSREHWAREGQEMERKRERDTDRDKRYTQRDRPRDGEGLELPGGGGCLPVSCSGPSAPLSPLPPSPSLARNPGVALVVASLGLAPWASGFTRVALTVPRAPGEPWRAGSYRVGTKRILWE